MNRLLVAGCRLLADCRLEHQAPRARSGRDPADNQQPATSNAPQRLPLSVLLTAMLAFPAMADVTTAALAGRVTIGGAPAAGVTVTATSPALQHPRTTITGPRGTYWLGALPPGEYEVTFSRAGHTTLTRSAAVELARVARADAVLEPNADEEEVMSTVTSIGGSETTAITTHFDDATLDRLPLTRARNLSITPDPFGSTVEVDGVPSFFTGYIAEDLIEQGTAIRGAPPLDAITVAGSLLAVRTRHGAEDFFFSLRDTIYIDSGARHAAESTAGGPVVSQRLWFFGAAWASERRDDFSSEIKGLNAKLHAQLGASHHLDGSYTDSRLTIFDTFPVDQSSAWLQHTAVIGPRFTWETHAARAWSNSGTDLVTSRASYVAPTRTGDHVLTAGVTQWQGESDLRAFFVNDRWSAGRWVVNAGVRHEGSEGNEELMPRLAATYDLGGDGRRALVASYGEYAFGDALSARTRVGALGFATALGRTGAIRVDVLRRDVGRLEPIDALELDGRYRLFDRFEAGLTYSYTRADHGDSDAGNLWLSAEVPIGDHEIGVTVLQRYFDAFNPPEARTLTPTDVALRYAIPFSRIRLTLAADVTNVFDSGEQVGFARRELRFWVRMLFR